MLSQNNLLALPAKGGRVSALAPRFKSSTYLSMRVEDPVNRRGGLKLGSVSILNQNLYFEMASKEFIIPVSLDDPDTLFSADGEKIL